MRDDMCDMRCKDCGKRVCQCPEELSTHVLVPRELIEDVISDIEDAISYAGAYLAEKHGYQSTIDMLSALLADQGGAG